MTLDEGSVAQVATVFGRPKWDKIFKDIKKDHPGKRVGVFVCGPVVRASTEHAQFTLGHRVHAAMCSTAEHANRP